ncbi:Tll0287-like domain-containing protein [Pontibacter sp. JAM-7]|uniref:Tll0287-like domain-containing protein n=1 Tax=Pontibacter sp. JAM-7 TaxID=3366581 RepID=UPI003AF76688
MMKKAIAGVALAATTLALTGCQDEPQAVGIKPELYTDSLFAVMKADRTNYTKLIIKRLGPAGADAIAPKEHWQDLENGAPLPAQMFRAGAEAVAEMTDDFTYSLQSIWPINSQNAPRTEIEKQGLEYIAANPGKNFYGEEKLGDTTYFTAVYPDVAVATPCVTCHNEHKDSPRNDFKIGEVMGGVVIRVPLGG